MGRKMQSREEWNRVRRWEMIMPRTGAHWGREYSVGDNGEERFMTGRSGIE